MMDENQLDTHFLVCMMVGLAGFILKVRTALFNGGGGAPEQLQSSQTHTAALF